MSISSIRYLQFLFMFCVTTLVASCGGGSSGDPDTPSSSGASITLQARSAQGTLQTSFEAGESITLEMRARNDFGRGEADVTLSVSTSLGSVTQTDVLTDSNGDASVTMQTTTDLAGVAVVTATGTIDGTSVTVTRNLQINAATPQDPAVLTLSLLDETCTTQLNSQSAGSRFCVLAQYTQDGTGIADEIVNFSTTLGTVTPVQALTDASGVAKTLISSALDDVNAGQLTATVDTLSTNKNFQFTAPQASDMTLTLSVLDASCSNTLNSVSTGESLCLRAQLATNGLPNADEIIQFTAPLGTLRQATSLTNSQGIATAIIDSDGTVLGAAEANATFDTLSATANYQFTSVAPPVSSGISVTLSMTVDDTTNNRFRSDETAKLVATVRDSNNAPVINEIVTFSAELGNLQTTTALTNAEGVAQVTLTGTDETLGAGVATATRSAVSDTLNYEILAANSVEQEIKLGHFDGETFVEGVIGLSGSVTIDTDNSVVLSAGGTLGLEVVLVDQDFNRFTAPTEVSFTSTCTVNQQATLDATTTSVNGSAKSTYEDVSCAGPDGNQDTVVASVQVNGVTVSANRNIALLAESVGAIQFVSATPESIVLKGTGGQGSEEASTLTFRVLGELGNPLAQRSVDFSLDTSVGGIELNPAQGLTNSEGLVTARIRSGTVPTPVRVTASVAVEGGNNITTQSDLVAISTGIPDQNSMTLSTTIFNPEANNRSGVQATITTFLSDTFNNPVPDGTTVLFTTEGGTIPASCNTLNGSCSVLWQSSEPRVDDHRITILATAIGHETFIDRNGNNVYESSDGAAISNLAVDSGLVRQRYPESGFGDMAEAWRDDNENYAYDPGETFVNYNGNDNGWDAADGLFNGPQCTAETPPVCGDSEQAKKLNVRKALVMVMSSSAARIAVLTDAEQTSQPDRAAPFGPSWIIGANSAAMQGANNDVSIDGPVRVDSDGFIDTCEDSTADICLAEGRSINLTVALADTADRNSLCSNDSQPGQILPASTSVAITTTANTAELLGNTQFTIPNTYTVDKCAYGGIVQQITLTNSNDPNLAGEEPSEGLLTISLVYPESNINQEFSLSLEMIGR